MKTTLNLDDRLVREVKKRAAEEGTSMTRVVEDALRAALIGRPQRRPSYAFRFPAVEGGGPPRVDVADRDALYDLMEGRE